MKPFSVIRQYTSQLKKESQLEVWSSSASLLATHCEDSAGDYSLDDAGANMISMCLTVPVQSTSDVFDSARTVPVQCPYSARYSARTVPVGKTQ